MLNVLTVDVEDWYHTNGLNIDESKWSEFKPRVRTNTLKLLNLFDEYNVKATFFILGSVAKNDPDLIKEIMARGHEIGTHSMKHKLVYKQSIEDFKKDFIESIQVLEAIAEKKIIYYRAPSWSISKDRLSLLEFLDEHGIVADSSLQPFKTPLSGLKGVPLRPFKPIINNKKLNIIEFPPTVMKLFGEITFPFAGGFYLRFFPYFLIKSLFKMTNKIGPGMVYVHPWELDPNIPRFKTNWLITFIQYYKLRSTEQKLRKLLQNFQFASLGEVLKTITFEHKQL